MLLLQVINTKAYMLIIKTMNTEYKIKNSNAIICQDGLGAVNYFQYLIFDGINPERIDEINFHIKSQDYFGTMATVVDIILQDKNIKKGSRETLSRFRSDLEHLQKNFKIIPKKSAEQRKWLQEIEF